MNGKSQQTESTLPCCLRLYGSGLGEDITFFEPTFSLCYQNDYIDFAAFFLIAALRRHSSSECERLTEVSAHIPTDLGLR